MNARPSTIQAARARNARRAVIGALGVWGLMHVVGGISLLTASPTAGLDTLAPDARTSAPAIPGDGAEALLRFHALNIVLGGIAVLALTVWWARTRVDWRRDVALATAIALDVGLIVFLVLPGWLPPTQGLIGPVLVGIATVAAIATARTARPAHPAT